MAIEPGSLLGPYQIIAKIGAGGMGDVYQARDARLGRDVAIKVLPDHLSQDSDRLRRFELEARATSALNHPNIVSVFDVGNDGGRFYVVAELLEGATLRHVIKQGAIPLRKLIGQAEQIALGMAAAHSQGVVHRDLKPENVFVTKDGRIKILDFGLAKLVATPESGELSETISLSLTQPGVIAGTAGYMSPEQVRGEAVDARSDIFSFGAVLYEMCSGKRAFEGETAVETMTAILRSAPPSVRLASPDVPMALDEIVQRCLEKKPGDRFQSASDLAFALETLTRTISERTSASAPRSGLPRRQLLTWLAGVPLAGSLVGAYYFGRGSAQRARGEFRKITYRQGYVPSARFSPDGQTIIYSAAWDDEGVKLFSGRRDRPEYRALDLPPAYILGISSKGDMALLSASRPQSPMERIGTLSVAPLAGGSPRELIRDVQSADWGPDGKELAVVRPVDRYRLEFPVGKSLYETEGKIADPRVSHDGQYVAFIDQPRFGDDAGFVAIIDRNGKRKRLSRDWRSCQGLAWSPTGSELLFTAASQAGGRQLYAVSLGGKERTLAEEANRLLLHDAAADGTLLLSHENYRFGIVASLADGKGDRDLSWLDAGQVNDLARDGRAVAFFEGGAAVGGNPLVYFRRVQDSQPVQLGAGMFPAISPNLEWVACLTNDLHQIALLPTGPGESRRLPAGALEQVQYVRWLPDSQRVIFSGAEKGKKKRVYVQDIAGGLPRAISAEGLALCSAQMTPDGHNVVACENGRGFLLPVAGGNPKAIAGWKTGQEIIGFSADGRSAYVQLLETTPAQVERLDLATGKREPWKTFRPANMAGVTGLSPIVLSADEKAYAYNYERVISELHILEGAL